MGQTMGTAQIVHFSDVLCVWAYVAERRMTELRGEFGSAVEIERRFVSIFGLARAKLEGRWRDKGGIAAYGEHVRGVVAGFDHVVVHPEVWSGVTPTSSWPAHLALCAVRLLEREGKAPPGSSEALAWRLREAFFRDAHDISRREVLLAAAEQQGLDPAAVAGHLASGRAHAELASDYELARDQDVRVSPSLLLNEARQRLNGNVGYRVIAANVREVLEKPPGQLSWC
jgi:predicted DsbA family dithiol-disulfide isomerase